MWKVQKALIIGIGVDSGHESTLNAEGVINGLSHRSQTVGCARSVRNNIVGGGVIFVLIYAHDDRDVFTLSRCGNDHLFGAGSDVLSSRLRVSKDTG